MSKKRVYLTVLLILVILGGTLIYPKVAEVPGAAREEAAAPETVKLSKAEEAAAGAAPQRTPAAPSLSGGAASADPQNSPGADQTAELSHPPAAIADATQKTAAAPETTPGTSPGSDAGPNAGTSPGAGAAEEEVVMDLSSPEARARTVEALRRKSAAERAAVELWAKKNGAETRGSTSDGGAWEILRLDEKGRPEYTATDNFYSAVSIAADKIRLGNSLGNGSGWTVGVWDGGKVRTTHREFGSRAAQFDNTSPLSSHATHVAGTVGAAGVDSDAMGMASGVNISAWDWTDDLKEMSGLAATTVFDALNGKLTVSNHSYGIFTGWDKTSPSGAPSGRAMYWWGEPGEPKDRNFGIYDEKARKIDEICYNAPYFLPFKSAGNSRGHGPSSGDTVAWRTAAGWQTGTQGSTPGVPAGNGQHDTCSSWANSKNIVTIGNCEDATRIDLGSYGFDGSWRWIRDVDDLPMVASSSYGPADDGRIKPDVVANGENVYSTVETADDDYDSKTGTSMASPSAAGAAILLQQRYSNLNGEPMRASMLKGLIIHTADMPGTRPDAGRGFGLINAKAAADHIVAQFERPADPLMHDGILIGPGGDRNEFYVEANGDAVYKATLCWTDPPGVAQNGLDNVTPALVHDLDLRIFSPEGGELRPWKLSRSAPDASALAGDNTVDNVEKIGEYTATNPPAGLYKVVVSHKGTLTQPAKGGLPAGEKAQLASAQNVPAQVYSLLLSGFKNFGTLAEAVDAPSLNWTQTGANAVLGWGYQASQTHDGQDAAQSPPIKEHETTALETTVTGPGELSFWARVSSAPAHVFRFKIDSIVQGAALSGESGWVERMVTVPAGQHTLRWEFARDHTPPAGSSRVWLDQISWRPKPLNLTAAETGSGVFLTWSYPRPQSGYIIYSNATPSLTGAASTRWSGGSGSAFQLTVVAGLHYAVKVIDRESGLESPLSDWAQGKLALDAPGWLKATDGSLSDRVEVMWGAVAGASEYVLTRTPAGGVANSVTVTGTSYNDTAASPGVVITYSVKARHQPSATLSPASVSDTGFRLDLAAVNVTASDGTEPLWVAIRWNGNQANVYRVLRTATNVSPAGGNVPYEVAGFTGFSTSFTADETAAPGIVYYYWVQVRPNVFDAPWGAIIGSDAGSAGPAADFNYTIAESGTPGGPVYQWVDISGFGEQVLGPRVVTMSLPVLVAGTQFYPIANLLNNSGLSETPVIADPARATHEGASATTAWVTDAIAPDYFAGGGVAPQIRMQFGVERKLTDLLIWGYNIGGSPNANEAKRFKIDMLHTVGGSLVPTGVSVTVESPALLVNRGARIPLGGSYQAQGVLITILDNWYGPGAPGGDRVGLGEIKFIGEEVSVATPPFGLYGDDIYAVSAIASRHGYIAANTDSGEDAANDATLPAAPGAGESGVRVLPYHDAMRFDDGAGVWTAALAENPFPIGRPDQEVRIWQWKNARLTAGGAPFSFEAVFFTATKDWLFQYQPGNPGGGGATIGIEHTGKNKGTAWGINRNGAIPVNRGYALRFALQNTAVPLASAVQTVTTLTDENNAALGQGAGNSLRELIKLAPAGADGIVRIAFPSGSAGQTLTLLSEIVMDRKVPVAIDGASAPGLTISGGQSTRLFSFVLTTYPSVGSLTLRNLTLANGWATGDGGAFVTPETYDSGDHTLEMENVTITNCRATARGGALALRDNTRLRMINCTLSGNQSVTGGGAIFQRFFSRFRLSNCTITANSSTGAGSQGGGILNTSDAPSQIQNLLTACIVAGNTAPGGGADIQGPSGSGSYTYGDNRYGGGYNLIGSSAGAGGLTLQDIIAADPRLGPLFANGGAAKTHALLADSPAVDAAVGAAGGIYLPRDQRGVSRGGDGDGDPASGPGGPDIGAYELIAPLTVTTIADTVNSADNKTSLREAVQIANAMEGGTITFDRIAMGGGVITLNSELPVTARSGVTIDGDARPLTPQISTLGTGAAALLGGDLTDPENNGSDATELGTGFNWVRVTSSAESSNFLQPEGAFNVFDNKVGGGEAKWCCDGPQQHITVEFAQAVSLTHFTITSSNDSPERDPRDWQILGSNDGVNFTPVFSRTGDTTVWTLRNQVVRVDLGRPAPLYRFIRYQVLRTGSSFHALGELEYFGTIGSQSEATAAEQIILSGNNASRIFNISTGSADLRNLTLTGGKSADGNSGAILNGAGLSMLRCTVKDSTAGAGGGGGVKNNGFLGATDCTFSGNNSTGEGGGLSNTAGATASLTRCTLAKNSSSAKGGGLLNGGTLTLTGCTVSANNATAEGGGLRSTGTVTVENCIIAGNAAASLPEVSGILTNRLGANLLSGDPRLALLNSHGGATSTMPPMAGSLALDAASEAVRDLVAPGDAALSNAVSPSGSGAGAAFDNNPSTVFTAWHPGLLAYWDFNDASSASVSADRTAGWTASFSGSSVYTADAGGRSGLTGDRAAQFGVSGSPRLEVLDGAFLNTAAAADTITIAFWQKLDSLRDSSSFWGWSPSSLQQRGIQAHVPLPGNNQIYFDHGGCCGSDTRINGPAPAGVDVTQWTHFVFVKSGTQKQVWVNGALAFAGLGAKPLPTDFTKLTIGADVNGFNINGRIDDFAVYGVALTGSEIARLHQKGVTAPEITLTVTPSAGPSRPSALRLTAGPDRPESDPSAFRLEGSFDGTVFVPVAEGAVPAFASRGVTQEIALNTAQAAHFPKYRLVFPAPFQPDAARTLRIAEVELLSAPLTDQRGRARSMDGSGDGVAAADIGSAESACLFVTTAADESNGLTAGGVSLREAMGAVWSGDILYFLPSVFDGQPADTITLTGSGLTSAKALSIDALNTAAGVTVSGNNALRVFDFAAAADMTLRGVSITAGAGGTGNGGGIRNAGRLFMERGSVTACAAAIDGAGIRSSFATSSLRLLDCTISGNTVTNYGGGLSIADGGKALIERCTIEGNRAVNAGSSGGGGGIFIYGAAVDLVNCTVQGNQCAGAVAGLEIQSNGTLTLINTTVAGNSATGNAPGGINVGSGVLYLTNSIVGDNTGIAASPDIKGAITAQGGKNLIGSTAGITAGLAPGQFTGTARLGSLSFNGGPTKTMALLAGSPALDAGDALISLPPTDQRGSLRQQNGRPDLGAFESAASSFTSLTDSDGDGMSDDWELLYGFNPASSADGTLDADRDGSTNAAEYLARTNPLNGGSLLKLTDTARAAAPGGGLDITLTWASVPGVVYSVWQSPGLNSWTPVAGSNLIAIADTTRMTIREPAATRMFYTVNVGAAPGIAEPVNAPVSAALAESSAWLSPGISAPGAGLTVTSWQDVFGADTLLPSGGPLLRPGVTPTGANAVEFRGGTFNDVLATNVPAGRYALNGATALTIAVSFKPDGNGESVAGTNWYQKSALVNGDVAGFAHDTGLSYGEDAIWFGVGDAVAGDFTMQVPAGRAMAGGWWTAVATWTANDGAGKPGCAAWLFDAGGNETGAKSYTDPNTAMSTTGRFKAPRVNSGFALGGERGTFSARNFDGHIAGVRVWRQPVNSTIARAIGSEMAGSYTKLVEPE